MRHSFFFLPSESHKSGPPLRKHMHAGVVYSPGALEEEEEEEEEEEVGAPVNISTFPRWLPGTGGHNFYFLSVEQDGNKFSKGWTFFGYFVLGTLERSVRVLDQETPRVYEHEEGEKTWKRDIFLFFVCRDGGGNDRNGCAFFILKLSCFSH
jgi:hypothetical protein